MKFTAYSLMCLLSFGSVNANDLTAGMTDGKPTFRLMGPIAFGPQGILFIADARAAAITAIATADGSKLEGAVTDIKIEGLDAKLAAKLGAPADQVSITDMAVNPASGRIYFSVLRGRGPEAVPVLFRTTGKDGFEEVALDAVKHSRGQLPDAPADGETGNGQRRSNPRLESITDIAHFEDRLLIAGLSNEEFASTLRATPFPFKAVEGGTSVEIYHGAHGKFETRSPIRTFVPFNVGGDPELLAAYTCTPLVRFPVRDIKPGAKIRGKTIAELGNRNRPLDMVVYKKGGKDWLLMANSSRGVMKISTDGIETAASIETPVGGGGIQGQAYETVAGWTGVEHLDKLDETRAVLLRKAESGLTLETVALP